MKIAYCFSGHLRTFRDNPTIINHALRRQPGDVFIHTYPRLDVDRSLCWHDTQKTPGKVSSSDYDFLYQKYVCDGHEFRIFVDSMDAGAFHLQKHHAKAGYRHSLSCVHRLRERHERANGAEYDLVVGLRFDLFMTAPLQIPDIIEPETIYAGYNPFREEEGVDGEVFTMGRPEVMSAMFVPTIPPEESEKIAGYGWVGELLFTDIRKRLGFKYQAIKQPYGLLRAGGEVSWVCQ